MKEVSFEIRRKVRKPLSGERAIIDNPLHSRRYEPIGNYKIVGCPSDKNEYAGLDKTEDEDAKAYKSAKYKKAARRLTKTLWMILS